MFLIEFTNKGEFVTIFFKKNSFMFLIVHVLDFLEFFKKKNHF
jgi:hypothetical protein